MSIISIPYLLSVGVTPPQKKSQVHVLVIIVYVQLSYSSFSPYGKCDSDQSSFHHKSLEQYMYMYLLYLIDIRVSMIS
jgi:hypothetical protein